MSSTGSEVRARMLAGFRDAAVALAAGYDATLWGATDYPHVFDGDTTNLGGRNRGRMPFVEIFLAAPQPFVPEGNEIGMVETQARIRAHVGGADRQVAYELAEGIIMAGFAVLRADDYFSIGQSEISGYASQPLWHKVDASFSVQHSYDPSTFEGG